MIILEHWYYPEPTTYRFYPFYFSWITTSPILYFSIVIAWTRVDKSVSLRLWKRIDFFTSSLIEEIASGLFSINLGLKFYFLLNWPYTSALIPCLVALFFFLFSFNFSWIFLSISDLSYSFSLCPESYIISICFFFSG